MPSRFCLLGSALLLAVAGCSQQVSPPATVPVSGHVTLHGKPAEGVRVTMHPQFSMGRITWGVVGESGSGGEFKVGTGGPGNGAPRGDYIVTFTKPKIISDQEHNGVETEVDDFEGKYSDPETSTWKVTVKKGENDLGTFQLD
jgi:hypothetical protein